MRHIILIIASAFLIGCATQRHSTTYPPSPDAVVKSLSTAKSTAASVVKYVSPEGRHLVDELNTSLDAAQLDLSKYVLKVDQQARDLDQARNDANYYHALQIKALKELWAWRLFALAEVCAVVAYVGIKTSWRSIA